MNNIKPLALLLGFFLLHFTGFAQFQFIENKGQWEQQIDFKTDIKAGAFFIEKNSFSILQHNAEELEKLSGHSHDLAGKENASIGNDAITLHSHAIKVHFEGASAGSLKQPGKILPGYNNYFTGNDKDKWQGNCRLFEEIIYTNVYPGIDVRYYTNAGSIKYDFLVHPGADAGAIKLNYEGADQLAVKNNELHIYTSLGTVKESYPYSYQLVNGERKKIACRYVLKGNTVQFNLQQYDPTALLVIDPTLIFSSFTGSTADNWGNTSAPGPDGSFFSGGIVFANGYPVSAGAFSQTFNGGLNDDGNGPFDIAIFKFSPDGTSRQYATYLGGNGNEQLHSMTCDAQGNLVVFGRTNTPVTTTTTYPATTIVGPCGKFDIVVTKFNAGGTALMGSVRIGGTEDDGINIRGKYTALGVPGQTDGAYDTRRNYGDDNRGDILLDDSNNIYIASSTQSTNFPVSGNPFQPAFGGGGAIIRQDGIILKINPTLSAIGFSTFFGGSGNDACFNLALNKATGNLYVSGATTSTDLPGNKINAISANFLGGATDGFVSIIKADGSSIVKTTYDGTAGNDMIYGLQLDKKGFVYITGTTTGARNVVNAAFSQPGGKQFISKLQPDLSAYLYSTNFGTNASSPNICPLAFYVDKCENVYLSGWGGALNTLKQYPNAGTTGLTTTANALHPATDGNDFYFFILQKNAAAQLYGDFFGQTGGFSDHADGGTNRFDDKGVLYQTICANCTSGTGVFPTTPGVWSPTNLSNGGCNQAAVKINMSSGPAVEAGIRSTAGGIAKDTICTATSLFFTDTVVNAKKYTWNFGDGSAEVTAYAPSNTVTHTFNFPGSIRVRLVAADSLSCNLVDTVYKTITVQDCTGSQFCQSENIYFSSDTTGATYQWQWMRTEYPYYETSFSNINDDGFTFFGATTAILRLKDAPPYWYGYQFRCLVNNTAGTVSTLKFVSYWTGAVNNQWENPGNWSCNKVPDLFTDVYIQSGTPVLNSDTEIRTLTAAAGASVLINPGFNLTIMH